MNITVAVISYVLVIGGLFIARIDDTLPRVAGIGVAIAGLIFFGVFGRVSCTGKRSTTSAYRKGKSLKLQLLTERPELS